jgi:hypothetical protein
MKLLSFGPYQVVDYNFAVAGKAGLGTAGHTAGSGHMVGLGMP